MVSKVCSQRRCADILTEEKNHYAVIGSVMRREMYKDEGQGVGNRGKIV